MAILPPTAEQDVCSIYLNLEACDPSDGRTTETDPEPLPPLDFSLLAPWHDIPIALPRLDPQINQEAYWETSPILEPLPSIPLIPTNDSTLLSSIEPSLVYSPSTHWLSTDDEDYVASDDMNSPLVRSRNLSPYPLGSYPMPDSYAEFIGTEESGRLFSLSSPSSSSVSLSTTDSEYCSSISPGTSAMTSPASSVLSLDDNSQRSCSVASDISKWASRLSPPRMRSRKTQEETGEILTDIVTQDSRKSSLKGRRRQRRQNPISSRRQGRDTTSRDLQDRDFSEPDQLPGVNGKDRPTCWCGKSFTRLSDLKRHASESTSCPLMTDGKKTKADTRFVCNQCGGCFSRLDSLDRHKKNRGACQKAQQSQKKDLRHGEDDSDYDE